MDRELIDQLAVLDPRLPEPLPGHPMDLAAVARASFVACYCNVAFGWYIAMTFADRRLPFPMQLRGKDSWIHSAYMFRLHSDQFRCPHVFNAFRIAHTPEAKPLKDKICGMLLAGLGEDPNSHRVAVAEDLDLPVPTVEAFDTLFYNVIDRQKDAAFISNKVYPLTRFVEFSEDYLKTAAMSDLLQRAGYNTRDIRHTAFLAGVGDPSFMSKLSAREDREQELTRHLMGNALLLVQSGVVNQRNVGISRAQTLVAASRQSGPTLEAPPITDAGQYMSDALRTAISDHDEQRLLIAKSDAGG